MFEKTLKKYKYSKKVWMAYQHYKLRIGDVKGAKDLFARSMQSLSKHKHIEVITKYASAEFEIGSQDRGRAVFEELINNQPKRSDLWHLYVDKEVKSGNIRQARQLFERMITSKQNSHNMKIIFKKYLNFEQKCGNVETQEDVKGKARAYVTSLM
jgi:rRNA biogenesis protein RRP5